MSDPLWAPRTEVTVTRLRGRSDFFFSAFAGSTIPFGMAKAVPDSLSSDTGGGFVNDAQTLIGISQMHDSGTGGSPSLGNFPIWMNNCTSSSWESCPAFWNQRK